MSPNNTSSGKSNDVIPAEAQGQSPGAGSGPGTGPGAGSVRSLMGELLGDIYGRPEAKRPMSSAASACGLLWPQSDRSGSAGEVHVLLQLMSKDIDSLKLEKKKLEKQISDEGHQLVKQLKKKNLLLMKREAHYDLITAYIQAVSSKTRKDTKMKFSLSPGTETGFSQWLDAMKMVAQLPGGMPSEFRTKLWLQLSEKHLKDQKVDWEKAETIIFNEWTNPDDEELGVQIVKDLHRTGCSLFCGEQEHNQALLKRVLLAYARWNKNVGYCQGFNMLAALILQVMDKDEKNAVKVMIYLIEGVLPESYFANNLRGLSVDMAVFRDLLRLRLPKLSKHLEALQHDTNSGTSYEPPLTNVFTMQWFLTLFSNCLPQPTVLRVWDLVFLYGNEVLLRTALAIWAILQDRVISVESADEFYSIMGVVTREMLEFGLMDANTLVKRIAMVDPFPNELQELREKYLYNISPWTQSVQCAARKGIKLFYSDAEEQDDTEDEDKIALTTAYGVFRRRESSSRELQLAGPTLDIGILKQQYAKLRQRQRQAHVIITAACSSNLRSNMGPGPSVSVNHLLMGKSALVNKGRRIGPPEGSIPPLNNKKANVREAQRKVSSADQKSYQWKNMERCATETKGRSPEKDRQMPQSEKAPSKEGQGDAKRNTNHDRLRETNSEEENEENGTDTSSSTELCDSEGVDSDGAPEPLDWGSSSTRGRDPGPNTANVPLEDAPISQLLSRQENLQTNENLGCDTNNLLQINKFPMKLESDIEGVAQKSGNLQLRSKGFDQQNMPVISTETSLGVYSNMQVQIKRFDNTTNPVSSINLTNVTSCDNILYDKPEVPMNRNVIETVESLQMEKPLRAQQDAFNKTEMGLNIIRENLQMLHKYSALRAEGARQTSGTLPLHEGSGSGQKEATVSQTTTSPNQESDAGNHKTAHHPRTDETSPGKLKASHLLSWRSTEAQKSWVTGDTAERLAGEKVNKEVNTEIALGVNELEIAAGKASPNMVDMPLRSPTRQSANFPRVTERFFKGGDADADQIKTQIEVSKNDWDLKMKKIAELETTTREALDEIQVHSRARTWFRPPGCPSPPEKDAAFPRRSSPVPIRSFDAITSRTEKLLANVEFGRPRPADPPLGSAPVTVEFDTRFAGPAPRLRPLPIRTVLAEPEDGAPEIEDKDLLFLTERKRADKDGEVHSERQKFNPFPPRAISRPKELGTKLGLYPTSSEDPPKKL